MPSIFRRRHTHSRTAVGGGGTPSAAPDNLTATGTASDITLAWDAVASVLGYNVYGATDPTSTFTLIAFVVGATTYVHVPPDTATRYYRVTAVKTDSTESAYDGTVAMGRATTVTAAKSVFATTDDGVWSEGNSGFDAAFSSFFVVLYTSTEGVYNSYMRTTGWAIPRNSTITSAIATFRCNNNGSGTTAKARIRAIKSSGAAPTTYSGAETATRTTALVDWTVPAWVDSTLYASPDLATVIAERVADAGWSSGSDIVLYFEDNGSTQFDGMARRAWGRDNSSLDQPYLTITYQQGGGVATADATAPAVPTGLAASTTVSTNLLDWNNNADGDLAGYNVYRGTVSGTYTKLNTTLVDVSAFTDTTAAGATTYYYVVTALDTSGNESAVSSEVNASRASSSGLWVYAPVVTAGYRSLGVTLATDGDDNNNASVTCQFRVTGAGSWRNALPPWASLGGASRTYRVPIVELAEATSYDVQVTGADADGLNTAATITTVAVTKTIPSAVGAATYFLSPSGSDAAAGTSGGAAWLTIEKAMASAPSGAIVQLAAGYYLKSTTTRTTPITFLAVNRAVDDAFGELNSGTRSVVESWRGSAPTGTANTGTAGHDNFGLTVAPWVLLDGTTINGYVVPNGSNVYRWTGAPVWGATALGVATTRAASPQRVPHRKVADAFNDGQRIEAQLTNNLYQWGFWQGLTGTTLYMRLGPNYSSTNPNSLFVSVGDETALLTFDGATMRLSGLELRTNEVGISFLQNSSTCVVDHCLLTCFRNSIGCWSTGAAFSQDILIYRCIGRDFHLRNAPGAGSSTALGTVSWGWIKGGSTMTASGVQYTIDRVGERNETSFTVSNGQRISVIECLIDGVFNGVYAYNYGSDLPGASAHVEVLSNRFRNIADDCLELERGGTNVVFVRNDIEYCSVMTSMSPMSYGPLVSALNRVWMLSANEVPASLNGQGFGSAYIFKMGSQHIAIPRVYLIHNTIWSNTHNALGWHRGWEIVNSGSGTHPWFWMQNNIVRVYHRIASWNNVVAAAWVEDYNVFGAEEPTFQGGYKLNGSVVWQTAGDMTAYRANFSGGAHTNIFASTTFGFMDFATVDALLTNTTTGNLTLAGGSPAIDAGVNSPNISDLVTTPSMGYQP